MKFIFVILVSMFVVASCGEEPAFVVEEDNDRNIKGSGLESDSDALGRKSGEEGNNSGSQVGGTNQENTKTANFGGDSGDAKPPKKDPPKNVPPVGDPPADPPVEPPAPVPPTDVTVLASCSNTQPTVNVQTVTFPARQDCSFGTANADGTHSLSSNGNIGHKQLWVTAREEDSVRVNLPDGAIICGMNLAAVTATVRFDDYFALRLNNYVIAGTLGLTNALDTDADGHSIWNWERIRGDGSDATGTRMDNDVGGWDMGVSEGALPPHDQTGDLRLKMELADSATSTDARVLRNAKLFAKLSGGTGFDVTRTVTGDNDTEDCSSSEATFNVSVSWVPKGTVAPD